MPESEPAGRARHGGDLPPGPLALRWLTGAYLAVLPYTAKGAPLDARSHTMAAKTSRTPRKSRKPAKAAASKSSARKRTVDAATMAGLIRAGKVPPHYAVAKSEGNGAVQAWIDLLPGWQSACARRIDAVVTRAVPKVRKAIKWHAAWYGSPGGGLFLGIGSFKSYLKLGFVDGDRLRPVPPRPHGPEPARALDVRESDGLDEAQLASWAKQASKLPGWLKA